MKFRFKYKIIRVVKYFNKVNTATMSKVSENTNISRAELSGIFKTLLQQGLLHKIGKTQGKTRGHDVYQLAKTPKAKDFLS